ncbi:hypothetical protein BLS_007626 [Venturia inaequalis]|uniref:PHD-type domain-containing protein n=1 Tax=Venturia inaequalis TaxID=5025 RepID=A0A8H3U9B8_VENIN|nr:hypothetical protein BLS_007626 [Venturia inaequalis]KAE9972479.1 hypothetical protein EG328_004951 [Venturia inaequalis]KAE9994280.1 hypothetical protein EG327_000125 [Venturia inaequalis]RDI81947.1 hypothetical protein Vi05172_g8102 [Venturia inaequalis]
MGSRKRGREQMEAVEPVLEVAEEPSTLQKLREMWEFASLMQYLFFFGKAVKLEDLDVEDFEDECIKPTTSERLKQIGLALLKFVSSHKGLTPEMFDEYTRRQYVAKAPKRNPFGVDDEPAQFNEFDVFTKIRILQQLSVWTLNNPNPIRERLDERESEQISWRIEPFGWDRDDRVYFVLDDNRLYRRTDAPPPPEIATPKPKAKAKKGGRSTRSNKRRRVSRTIPETSPEDEEEIAQEAESGEPAAEEEEREERPDDFHMQKWELIAVTLDEYNTFIDTIRKSKDPNEKSLVKSIQEHVFPILAEQEEERQRKEARRMKELELMQKLATSKRSSRLAGKMDKIKEQQEAEEAERTRREELEMAHREQRKQQELENARESRRETREQRLKEREVKRILEEERLQHEEELLKKIKTNDLDAEAARARLSERKLKADMEKRKRELDNLQQDDEWYFDCSVCGVHGDNLDDGTHSIACEKCNVWQHSACHGISVQQAEREEFHFLCKDCNKKAANPVPSIKLKFGKGTPSKGDDAHAGKNGTQPSPAPRPSAAVNGNGNGNGKGQALVYPGPPPPPPGSSTLSPSVSGATTGPRPGSSASPYQWQPPVHHYTPVTGPPAYNGYYQPPPPQGMYNPQSIQARPAPQQYQGAPPMPYQYPPSAQAPVAHMQHSQYPPAQPSPTRPSPQMYVPPVSASPPPAMAALSPQAQYTPQSNHTPQPQHFTPPAQYAAPYQPGFSPAKHASPRIPSSPSLSSVTAPIIPPPHSSDSRSPIPVKHAPPNGQHGNGLGLEHLGATPSLPAPSIGNGSFVSGQNGTNGSS